MKKLEINFRVYHLINGSRSQASFLTEFSNREKAEKWLEQNGIENEEYQITETITIKRNK